VEDSVSTEFASITATHSITGCDTSPAVAEQATITSVGTSSASAKTLLVLEGALAHSRFIEVVHATGLAKATTHRIIATLVNRSFVSVAADGRHPRAPLSCRSRAWRSPADTISAALGYHPEARPVGGATALQLHA